MDLEGIMPSEMSDTYIWNFLFKIFIGKKKKDKTYGHQM